MEKREEGFPDKKNNLAAAGLGLCFKHKRGRIGR
jgi:hypothetical protein